MLDWPCRRNARREHRLDTSKGSGNRRNQARLEVILSRTVLQDITGSELEDSKEKEKNQLDFIFVLGTGLLGTWSAWSWGIHMQSLSAKGTIYMDLILWFSF